MPRRTLVICALAAWLIALVVVPGAEAGVACNSGFVEYNCPDEYPVCCAWPENGVVGACCPPASVCALFEGECLVKNSTSPTNNTSHDHEGGVTIGVSEAAAFITFAAIGFIVAIVGCAFLGFKTFVAIEVRRQRRREAEREALLRNPQSDESADDTASDTSGSSIGEEGQCKICFEHTVNCVLMPCGHVCTCRACAGRCPKCPVCRVDVQRFVPLQSRIYHKEAPIDDAASPATARREGGRGKAKRAAADAKSEELVPSPRSARAAPVVAPTVPSPRRRGESRRSSTVAVDVPTPGDTLPHHQPAAEPVASTSSPSSVAAADAQPRVARDTDAPATPPPDQTSVAVAAAANSAPDPANGTGSSDAINAL